VRRVVVAIVLGMLAFGVAAMPAGATATEEQVGKLPVSGLPLTREELAEALGTSTSQLVVALSEAPDADLAELAAKFDGLPAFMAALPEAKRIALENQANPPTTEPPPTTTTHEETPPAKTTTPEPTPTATATTPATTTPVNAPAATVTTTHATTPRFRVLARRTQGKFTIWTIYAPSAGKLLVHRRVIRRVHHAGILTVRVKRGTTVVWRSDRRP
jgi:hypothetical protein